jgi:hypothetical protein
VSGLQRFGLSVLNFGLHAFHQAWIVFTLIGWIFCETRILHLIVISLTLISWYALGPLLKKGDAYGYCVVTDIQWAIRRRLGFEERQGGYVKYIGDHLFGKNFNESLAARVGAAVLVACIAASLVTIYLYGSCGPFSA